MEAIRDLDVGDYFVSYSPTNHNGSKYVDITVINKDGRFFQLRPADARSGKRVAQEKVAAAAPQVGQGSP